MIPPPALNGRLDANDFMYGNDGFDVMAGDNAILVRTLVGGQWVSNTFNAGIQHAAAASCSTRTRPTRRSSAAATSCAAVRRMT